MVLQADPSNHVELVRWLARIRPMRALLGAFAQAPHDRIRDPVSLAGAFGLQLATITLDAATLYATLAAVGEPVNLGSAFASVVVAMIAEVVGIAPGGLGTFEGTCVALLHVTGVPLEPRTPAWYAPRAPPPVRTSAVRSWGSAREIIGASDVLSRGRRPASVHRSRWLPLLDLGR